MAFWMCGFELVVDTFGFELANRNQTFADGVRSIERFFVLSPLAWSAERSSDTSFEPRWMFKSCAAELTLRMKTVETAGFFGPQYCGFLASTTWVVVEELLRMYGPLPADCELRYDSALSDLSASAAAEPPWDLTTFELTMPSDVLATSTGIAGFGVFDLRTTVYGPFAL